MWPKCGPNAARMWPEYEILWPVINPWECEQNKLARFEDSSWEDLAKLDAILEVFENFPTLKSRMKLHGARCL